MKRITKDSWKEYGYQNIYGIQYEVGRYLCRMDGDTYADTVTEQQKLILNSVIAYEPVENVYTKVVTRLKVELKDGRKGNIKLYTSPNGNMRHFTDFKINIW